MMGRKKNWLKTWYTMRDSRQKQYRQDYTIAGNLFKMMADNKEIGQFYVIRGRW